MRLSREGTNLLVTAGFMLAFSLFVAVLVKMYPGEPGRNGGYASDAYILVRADRVSPLWDYQQLPMKDCAWCHRTVNLNRHHVIPQAANPALRDVRENLVVLCRDCHFVLGHRCDWKQYNPDVLYICTHFTNCVRSADTRYALTNGTERAEPSEPAVPTTPTPTTPTNVTIDTNSERFLRATNDVPESMRPALERILRSGL